MDVLWSPWRYDYINANSKKQSFDDCVFCSILKDPAPDEEKFILYRADFNFVILNIYPYVSGHLMIVPFAHMADLDELPKETSDEMMELAKRCQKALREAYRPDGFNMGINLGKAAGAGVAGHIHLHALPRWIGDANFMTSVGQTRTIPESLTNTYQKLKGKI